MHPHVEALFELTRASVSDAHIADFSPSDPSYTAYVNTWSKILHAGRIPHKPDFNLSEVISLTGWINADTLEDQVRFKQYRRFTTAVAVALIENGNETESVRIANYLAHDLIVDTCPSDQDHFKLIRQICPLIRETLVQSKHDEDEYPFFTYASLILANMAQDFSEMESIACKLIADESKVRNNDHISFSVVDSRFLFGLTVYDQFNRKWIKYAEGLFNPNGNLNIQLVIDSIAQNAK